MMMNAANRSRSSWAMPCIAVLMLSCAPGVHAADAAPKTTQDGLELKSQSKTRVVYVKPGASLAQYDKVAILDCLVEFEPDWQKDYNRSRVGLEDKVSDKDVARMKSDLAAEFKKVFTKELQDKGGYQLVDVAGPDVLVLRPALLNVEVTAPDLMSAGFSRTVVRSAGQMTLYLELWDSATNTLLARIEEAKADETGLAQAASRASNTAAADQILRDWARELRERLDEARAPSP